MRIFTFLFILVLTFSSLLSLAQAAGDRFSAVFNEATIDDVAKQIESQTRYRVFYDSRQFDSLRVSKSIQNQAVDEFFTEIFKSTDFYFAIDPNKRIFLTRQRAIDLSLPAGMKPQDRVAVVQNRPVPVLTDLSNNSNSAPPAAALESRVYEIGINSGNMNGNAVIKGYLRNANTGEPIAGAAVFIEQPRIGATTDQSGFYSLELPKGAQHLKIRALGLKDTYRQIMLYADGTLNVEVQTELSSLREVVISADKVANIRDVPLGVEKINIATIKQVPTVFGEADVVKVVMTLPGVKSVGEASSGFNVRGGATDQNLILLNEATIYNPMHFFGLFSAFNPEVVSDVQLYKSSIPARYGGRLSSVLEVNGREGNKKEITGSAGIGLITSRVNVEGPLVKDKSSFIFGGRTTYSNWILNLLPEDASYKGAKASFYDLNLMLNDKLNENNDLYFTGYLSSDESNLNTDTLFGYKNINASLKWKHLFGRKMTGVFTGGLDRYQYNNHNRSDAVDSYDLDFSVQQMNLKADFSYFLNPRHTIDFGASMVRYQLEPGSYSPRGGRSLVIEDNLETEHGAESAIHLANRFDVTNELSLDIGLRYSLFQFLGPKTINEYAPGVPRDQNSLTGTTSFGKGETVKTYHGPEIRAALRYAFDTDFSVKAGYNTLRQYIHMLSSTTAISPTDIWKLSDSHIRPQTGDQFSIGFYKNFKNNTIETSVESYYKRIQNYLDYKSGSRIVMNHHIENAVFNTKGKAYGVEVMIKKLTGKFNGWLSYTYSRILLRQDDPLAGEMVNQGDFYPSNYDKPHDVTLISNFRISHRISFSFNATYSTGRPVTVPIGKYYYAGAYRALYSDRNSYRVPDYFRTDFSLNIDGNHRVNQRTHNFWTIGAYNLTGRKNVYSTYFTSENQQIKGYKLSVFGSVIPFLNYNIKF